MAEIQTLIAAARKRQAEQEAEKRRNEIAQFRDAAERVFTATLRETLALRYDHSGYNAQAHFDFEDETWRLVYTPAETYAAEDDPGGKGYSTPARWEATITRSERADQRHFSFERTFYDDEHAEDALLLALGKRYDAIHGIERELLDTNSEPPF